MTEAHDRDQALRTLTEAWLGLRQIVPSPPPSAPKVVRAEVLRPGRPGLLDVVAEVEGGEGGGPRLAHFVVGLRGVADE
jgi:hypothetical protein